MLHEVYFQLFVGCLALNLLVTLDQLMDIWHISVRIQPWLCGFLVVFNPQLLHVSLIQNTHVMQDDYTINNVLYILLIPKPCWSFDYCIFFLEHTKCSLNILPIICCLSVKCACLLFRGLGMPLTRVAQGG
jgi:hypothetical protein